MSFVDELRNLFSTGSAVRGFVSEQKDNGQNEKEESDLKQYIKEYVFGTPGRLGVDISQDIDSHGEEAEPLSLNDIDKDWNAGDSSRRHAPAPLLYEYYDGDIWAAPLMKTIPSIQDKTHPNGWTKNTLNIVREFDDTSDGGTGYGITGDEITVWVDENGKPSEVVSPNGTHDLTKMSEEEADQFVKRVMEDWNTRGFRTFPKSKYENGRTYNRFLPDQFII